MTTINEIKDRLNAVAFAGRSYAGADRTAIAKAYTDAVAAFGTPDEASEIRLAIGEPIDALVNVSQGTPITPEEAGE